MAESLEEQTRRALRQMMELHKSSEPQPESQPPVSERPPSSVPQQSLLRFLRLDSDALLILPLILLLSREGADTALLLALVYVLL